MNSEEAIKRQLRVWNRRRTLAFCADGFLRLLSLAVVLAAILIFAGPALGFSRTGREILFISACGVFLRQAASRLILPLLRFRTEELIREVSALLPSLSKHLAPAWDFMRDGVPENVSGVFAREHIRQTAALVKKEDGINIYPFKIAESAKRRILAGFFVGLAVAGLSWNEGHNVKRALWPFSELPLETYLRISPGNKEVPWGKTVSIESGWISHNKGKPVLMIRSVSRSGETGSWRRAGWTRVSDGIFAYSAAELSEILEYRLVFEGLESSRYRLIPREYPDFNQVHLKITFPSYTGKPSVTEDYLPGELQVPAGSMLEISGVPERKLVSAVLFLREGLFLARKMDFTEQKNRRYSVSFRAEKDLGYSISLVSEDGWKDPSPPVRYVRIQPDAPPAAELLSPTFETEASPGEEIKVVYDAEDDFGLAAVELVRVVKKQENSAEGLKSTYALRRSGVPGPGRVMGDTLLRLEDCPDGSDVVFYVRACDHAAACTDSEHGRVKITDFRKIHHSLEKKISETAEAASALAAREEKIISRMVSSTATVPAGELSALEKDWARLAALAEAIPAEADADPYLNPGLREEYKAVAENLSYLHGREVPRAMQAARSGKNNEAAKRHATLRKELEKASSFFKKGAAFQTMRDMEASAARAENTGELMEEFLMEMTEMQGEPSAGWREMGRMVEKIKEELSSLFSAIQAISRMKQQTGAEQGNRIYQVPVGTAMGLADMLAKALAEKNLERAKALAKALLEQLGKARQALHEAAESQGGGGFGAGGEAVSADMERLQARWQELSADEAEALVSTRKTEDSLLKKMRTRQEEILAELIKKQAVLNEKARGLGNNFPAATMGRMRLVLAEFKAGKIEKSPAELSAAIAEMGEIIAGTSTLRAQVDPIKKGEEEVSALLDRLFSAGKIPDREDIAAMAESLAVQRKTTAKASDLALDLKKLEEKSVAVRPEVRESLGNAVAEMKLAEGSLGSGDASGAAIHQTRALEELDRGAKGLEESLQRQQRLEIGMGQTPSPGIVKRGRGGRTGSDISPVKLPSADDYRPPVEIRKKVLESLQEKFPESQEPVINSYLKRITE
ncbi:MAG: DUF4175 family protein [bacterium]